MKVIIDIPEENLKEMDNNYLSEDCKRNFRKAIKNRISLDDMTNEEIMQMMFPNMEVANDKEWFVHLQDGKGNIIKFSKDWGNAKYENS